MLCTETAARVSTNINSSDTLQTRTSRKYTACQTWINNYTRLHVTANGRKQMWNVLKERRISVRLLFFHFLFFFVRFINNWKPTYCDTHRSPTQIISDNPFRSSLNSTDPSFLVSIDDGTLGVLLTLSMMVHRAYPWGLGNNVVRLQWFIKSG